MNFISMVTSMPANFPPVILTTKVENLPPEKVKLIAGDASDRKFYRFFADNISYICMKFPKWEGGYGGDPLSWLGMHAALKAIDIPVPEVVYIDEENSCIWTEDFGDNFLNAEMPGNMLDMFNPNCLTTINYYKQALDLLVETQYPTKEIPEHPALNLAFDSTKLIFEMNFFITHFVKNFLELNPENESSLFDNLTKEFTKLCDWLHARERVLCHRDYHIRNVMLVNRKVKWIDFQDARMGPHSYDVVSIVRDSYVAISDSTKEYLYQYYFNKLNLARQSKNLQVITWDDFMQETLYMGLQRNVKAIGSFGYLATTKNKPNYLLYIKNTLINLLNDNAINFAGLNMQKEFPTIYSFLFDLAEGNLKVLLENKIKKSCNP